MSFSAVKQRVQEFVAVAQTWRPVRAYVRYTEERANLLAGGIAYVSLTTVGLVLVVGFTVLNSVLGGNPELKDAVVKSVAAQLPGLLSVDGAEGLVKPEDLFATNFFTLTGFLSLSLALFSGTKWLNAVREGIRAVWHLGPAEDFFLLNKFRDIGIMLTIGVLVLVSAGASLLLNAAAGLVLAWLGLAGTSVGSLVVRGSGLLLVLAMDTLLLIVLFQLLTNVRLPWRVLLQGALAGAVGFGVLKLFAGQLLGNVGGNNPVLASSAVLAGLALWLNLNARILLVAAAWSAESAVDAGRTEMLGDVRVSAQPEPAYVVPIGPQLPEPVSAGRRTVDTISLATGVVIGAVFLSGVRFIRSFSPNADDDAH